MEIIKRFFRQPLHCKDAIKYDHTTLSAEERDIMLDQLFSEQRNILTRKGHDYAGEDTLSNFRLAGMIANQGSRHPDAMSCLNLISTKVARLGQLLSSGKTSENESVKDSAIDLCNYSALLYLILKMEK